MSVESPLHVKRENRYSTINWITFTAMAAFHVGAVAALFYFSWTAVLLTAFFYWVSIGLGIGMGYHRLHTHRSYKVPKLVEYFFAVCGTLTLEGGPIFWVATHRLHHQHSDTDHDPHTPHHGGFWAHMGWILFGEGHHNDTKLMSKYAPDLAVDPFYVWLNTYHWVPLTVFGFATLALGGWPMVFWLVFFRVTAGLHATWLVNSATHMWGSRRFQTKDDSKNSWWVAHPDVRRRLAQQPPRPPDVCTPWPGVVRVRPHLAPDQGARDLRCRAARPLGRRRRPPEATGTTGCLVTGYELRVRVRYRVKFFLVTRNP